MKKAVCAVLVLSWMLTLCACEGDPLQDAVAIETLPTASTTATATTTTTGGSTTASATSATHPTKGTTTSGHEHSYEVSVVRAPSCEKDGERKYTCPCGDTYTEPIPALGHQWKDATCSDPKTCAVCGETEGKALGHNFEDGVCTVCGEEDPNFRKLSTGRWVYFTSAVSDTNLIYFDFSEPMYSEGVGRKITTNDPEWETSMTEGRHIPYGKDMLWQRNIADKKLTTVSADEKETSVTVMFDGGSITLERTAKNKFRVAAVTGSCSIRVNMILTWVSK